MSDTCWRNFTLLAIGSGAVVAVTDGWTATVVVVVLLCEGVFFGVDGLGDEQPTTTRAERSTATIGARTDWRLLIVPASFTFMLMFPQIGVAHFSSV
jgi:hypothetical protein